jgi:exopolysaccharide biosynthesis polyprenyl glycosylphosphotransferase
VLDPSVDLYLQFCRISDTATALLALFGLFVVDNLGRLPTGLDEFLGARLSVKNLLLVFAFAAWWHLSCRWSGLYDWGRIRHRKDEVQRVVGAVLLGSLVALIFPLTSVSGSFRIQVVVSFLALGTILILLARTLARSTLVMEARSSHNVVIVGCGPRGQDLRRQILSDPENSTRVIGFADSAEFIRNLDTDRSCSLGELEQVLMKEEVDEVLVALPVKSCYNEIQQVIEICERLGIPIKYSARLFDHARLEPRVEDSASGPFLRVPAAADGPRLIFKRMIDLVGASLALLMVSPLLLLIALGIRMTSPGPILFAQLRYGRGRRRFKMYKFRTMVENAEIQQLEMENRNEVAGPLFKIRSDPRVTRVGAFLRRSSLDELPQLWNVVRGEMSLVGPRPLPLRDVQRFSHSWLMRRFSVLPGLTGLWQVSGRSSLANEQDWIALDLAYVDHWSFWLDLVILARTVPAVLSGKGAS